MAADSGRTAIESHTEYVRGRVRCPECGEYVSTGRRRRGELCANCVVES